MSEVAPPRDRLHIAAIVAGWLAVVPLTVLLAYWAFLFVTLQGSERIQLITPGGLFFYTGLIWLVLALIAIILGALRPRPRLPVALGAIALAEIALGVLGLFS